MPDTNGQTQKKRAYSRVWWEVNFLRCLEADYGIRKAVKRFNKIQSNAGKDEINEDMVYRRRKDHPEFYAYCEEARERYLDQIELNVVEEGEKDARLGLKILERVRGKKWGLEREVKVKGTGKDGEIVHRITGVDVDAI